MDNKKVYLTIHGHFYQPPRENPWIEAIELQDSALPFHDWNERINNECYNPNSASKIVDCQNKILGINNNYAKMSFNFGPTLMSWLENHAPLTYDRIIKADMESIENFSKHGNAIAQVYNHMIMPLANDKDKHTQVIWGIEDFKYRFGREPEGMWLAETAVDDATLEVLVEHGIKFTVLSPFQAEKVRKFEDKNWTEVGWGNIDPSKPYRYYIKSNPEKYIDLFFYDGAISKSVAFDDILKDGNKFIARMKDGVSDKRECAQLINIATDGESYGHHSKFGDMALAYALRIKAEEAGFTITNYAEFLEKYPPIDEVIIKPVSSWSCFHGVGRWKEDCGCSTGGHPGWNQKWRKPLREAFDYLRDELAPLFEKEGSKYFKDSWEARNQYISVILDRNEDSVKKFFKCVQNHDLNENEKVSALKLLEIQRQSMLMYTSCGWFFSEISGIETTQIMKYAARAMQLASDFSNRDYEEEFLNKLALAQSNIEEYGSGKDVYEKFVKPAIVSKKQMISLWAITSLYENYEDESTLYCYDFKRLNYKKIAKNNGHLVIGRIVIQSKITLEKNDMIFALLQYSGGDFHCAIKEFSNNTDYASIQKDLVKTYMLMPMTEIIRKLDEYFGREYTTLKDIFLEERRKVLTTLLQGKLNKFANAYNEMYLSGRGSIYQMQNIGLKIPEEFKLAAEYTLSSEFKQILANTQDHVVDEDVIQSAHDIVLEAERIGVKLDREIGNKIYSQKVLKRLETLYKNFEVQQVEITLDIFKQIEDLQLSVDISEAQNIFFDKVYPEIGNMIEELSEAENEEQSKHFIMRLFELGKKLNINMDFYSKKLLEAITPRKNK